MFRELIYTDLGDLKQTITRGDKKYYMTFINDYSRYIKVYSLKNNDKSLDILLQYLVEVENQLNRKLKELDQIEEENT